MTRLIPYLCLLLLAGVPACTQSRQMAGPKNVVPITDFSMIAGKWEGLMTRQPATPSEDWVRSIIREDGNHEFASYREVGLFRGKGKLVLEGGKAVDRSEDGTITLTLYDDDGRRTLQAVGVTKRGLTYQANLTPKP